MICTVVLSLMRMCFQELREKAGSPMGSTGSMADSVKSESTGSSVVDDAKGSDVDTGKSNKQLSMRTAGD